MQNAKVKVQRIAISKDCFKVKRAILHPYRIFFNFHSAFCNQMLEIHKIFGNYGDCICIANFILFIRWQLKIER